MSRLAQIHCLACKTPMALNTIDSVTVAVCPKCVTPHPVTLFPAFFQPVGPGARGENVLVEGESSCFYHPQKMAAVTCDGCGRFLCALCDVEFSGQHLCPACIQSGKEKKKIASLENRRILYDDLALTLAILPLIVMFFATVITAPVTLYLSLRHWNTPSSIIPRTRWRFVVAILFSLLEISGWTFFLVRIFS